MRKLPELFEQTSKRRAHLPYKPGTAFSAKEGSIAPFISALRPYHRSAIARPEKVCCIFVAVETTRGRSCTTPPSGSRE